MKKLLSFFLLQAMGWICVGSVAAQPFIGEIRAFQHEDSLHAPPAHAILFVGSSSFRIWKEVQQDFPGYTIINRGFGGSTLPDVIRYADRIIYPYHPREVVIYCGENDLAASDTVTSKLVARRFETLFAMIRQQLPGVPVVFVSIKPSPSRVRLLPEMKKANALIRNFLTRQSKTNFVNVFPLMLNADGSPKKEIFLNDNLHMNRKGYAIWIKAIKPYLIK